MDLFFSFAGGALFLGLIPIWNMYWAIYLGLFDIYNSVETSFTDADLAKYLGLFTPYTAQILMIMSSTGF